jgi:hypothetical protein
MTAPLTPEKRERMATTLHALTSRLRMQALGAEVYDPKEAPKLFRQVEALASLYDELIRLEDENADAAALKALLPLSVREGKTTLVQWHEKTQGFIEGIQAGADALIQKNKALSDRIDAARHAIRLAVGGPGRWKLRLEKVIEALGGPVGPAVESPDEEER